MRNGTLCIMLLSAIPLASGQTPPTPQTQDAAALEAQYKACARHYIPPDKCTTEIYQQLKEKDNAFAPSLDATTVTAFNAVKAYQQRLRNPESMRVRAAYVTDEGMVCLQIVAQNGFGRMTTSNVEYITETFHIKRMRGKFFEDDRVCYKVGFIHSTLKSGVDVTEKVNQALKDSK